LLIELEEEQLQGVGNLVRVDRIKIVRRLLELKFKEKRSVG
jgi:hypothetical protein